MDASRQLSELVARHDQLPCPWCIPEFTWCPFCDGQRTVTAQFIIDRIRHYQRAHPPATEQPKHPKRPEQPKRPEPPAPVGYQPTIPPPPPPPISTRPHRWTADSILPHLVAARADLGDPFTRDRYRQWCRTHPGAPVVATICRHHRTWTEALHRAGIPTAIRPNADWRRASARAALTTFLNTGQCTATDYRAWRSTQSPRPPAPERILRWTGTNSWLAAIVSLNYPQKRSRR